MLKRMKHAGKQTLDQLSTLLERLRELPIQEKSRGVFHFRSRAFLHFHEDAAGIFADLRAGDAWQRHRVTTKRAQATVLARARRFLLGKS
ncbi:hypothetical protein PLCT1_00481 [Planctomycetaceae bacterium]|nr:hypothetical protein PLCT1_00481 [Planctomycetaceae bacterium]